MLRSGFNKELHLHLFKLAHTKDKLTRHDFVSEGFAGLCNTKRDFHTSGFLNIQKIHKNALCRLGTKIQIYGVFGRSSQLGAKHKVKLLDISPVFTSGYGTYYSEVFNELLESFQIGFLLYFG